MVCIAAFIILALIGLFVAIVSIFKPKLWKSYTKAMKKAWSCLWKKVRLQKCEIGFKEDIKNSILSRVIVKHPKWTKPLSILIEIVAVIIVLVTIWAILTAIKSLLALWVFGSCNVTKPSSCSLGAEVCSIDESEPTNPLEATGRWFTEWGEIFGAIPDKFRTYDANDYHFNYIDASTNSSDDAPVAVDIFDPGCVVCKNSYNNQKAAGFFNDYNVRLVPFAIQDAGGNYKFKNSAVIVKYMFAAEQVRAKSSLNILDKIFADKDRDGIPYQDKFNEDYTNEQAAKVIETWLKESGLKDGEIKEIRKITTYPEIATKMDENRKIIEDNLKVKGIPTIIYDGKLHTGLWKQE
ncbi:hypothetical protein IKF20_00760 [Candidatus Saccharibacteria bacterium]|nr:hypothetical protein [Candidatus Saccharibacteria bacterium]